MRRAALLALAIAVPVAATHAAALVVTKSATIVSDQVNLLAPKAIPNAVIDYTLRGENPNSILSGQSFGGVVIEDTIPISVMLRVDDYGGRGSGPVEFTDGSLLGLGLLGSGLSYGFGGLSSDSDGLEFSDGGSWTYTPVADAAGYDARVRAIRIRLTGTHAPSSSFRLRFRVKLK